MAELHQPDEVDCDGLMTLVFTSVEEAGATPDCRLNQVGRAYHGFSTLLCTPASLSQEVGMALGTRAGPARIRDMVTAAGFASLAEVAETPYHQVLEIRP